VSARSSIDAGRSCGPRRSRAICVKSLTSSFMASAISALLRIMDRQRLYRSHATLLQPIITTPAALEEFAAHLRTQARVGLDTEFLRERTYRAQLCLVQLASPSAAACIDPLALRPLAPLADVLGTPTVLKVMPASRQDLEVLLPIAGVTQPVFGTQIGA